MTPLTPERRGARERLMHDPDLLAGGFRSRATVADALDAIASEAVDRRLAELREAVGALPAFPTYHAGEGEDYMCPNCVTPWKCNGPHEPEPLGEPVGYEVDRAAVLAILTSDARDRSPE